jgi:hypothetical protein
VLPRDTTVLHSLFTTLMVMSSLVTITVGATTAEVAVVLRED